MTGTETRRATVLIVDDEPGICDVLSRYLTGEGHRTAVASCGEEALRVASLERPDIALVDLRMPGMDGLDLLKRFGAALPRMKVVLITAYGGFDTAIQASLDGAYDYMPKPLDLEKVGRLVSEVIAEVAVAVPPAPVAAEPLLLGTSARAARLREELDLAARRPAPVVLSGETGSGRLAAARRVHEWWTGSSDFLPFRCGELSAEELGALLADHEAGRPGFRVLLDLEDLPQERAAEVLERGAAAGCGTHARLLAQVTCTESEVHGPGARLVEAGRDRGWSVVRLPALRDRLDDLPDLTAAYLARIAARSGRPLRGLSEETIDWLGAQRWSGNLRQLENTLHSAALAARDGILRPDCIPAALRGRTRTETESR